MSAWGEITQGTGETDYFVNMSVYLIRRDMTVFLKELASCWTEMLDLLLVPWDVFGESIIFDLSVSFGCV